MKWFSSEDLSSFEVNYTHFSQPIDFFAIKMTILHFDLYYVRLREPMYSETKRRLLLSLWCFLWIVGCFCVYNGFDRGEFTAIVNLWKYSSWIKYYC